MYPKDEGGLGWYKHGWVLSSDTDLRDIVEYIGDKDKSTVLIAFAEGGSLH